jgi:hypothetical protein
MQYQIEESNDGEDEDEEDESEKRLAIQYDK